MVLRAVTVTLVAATASAELRCIGRVAHEVLAVPEVGNFSVRPTPERNHECLMLASGDQQKHFCTGVNANSQCTGAGKDDVDLGHHLHCKGCFVAAETDFLYKLDTHYFIPQHFSFGLENTKLLANVSIGLDGPLDFSSRRSSRQFFPQKIVHNIDIPFSTAISLEMPTDLFYDFSSSVEVTGDIGASFSVQIDEIRMQWNKGWGWHRRMSTPMVSYQHHWLPEEISVNVSSRVGFTSNLKVSFGESSWYTAKISGEVPVTADGSLKPKEHDAQGCLDIGIDVDVMQEADANFVLPLIGSIEEKHFGPYPWGLHKPSLIHKCIGKNPPLLVV